MATITRPEDIVVEFLRARLSDPRGRHTAESDSFTATASQTTFTLTSATATDLVRGITSVVVDGTTKLKWQEYTIDLKSKTITLKTGASVGVTVVVSYLTSASGSEWIYPDFPIDKLSKEKFPRISVTVLEKDGTRNGPYTASITNRIVFQVDCWIKDGYSKTISSKAYTKQDLAEYLGTQVESAFINYVNDLYDQLYDYEGITFGNLPYEEDTQKYRHGQRFVLYGTNVGH